MQSEILHTQQAMLQQVKTLVQHHKQMLRVKGEAFNIYNILNLQTNEVRTHSAFIAALLDPQGTHFMGAALLNAFLDVLAIPELTNHLDTASTTVTVEYYAGLVNTKTKTGGRIDILLQDGMGNTIVIENKIDAGDQEDQIQRYCNFNREKNKVVYLSKYGDAPSEASAGTLEVDKDYIVVGYSSEILTWLERCQELAYDQPVLRESIKQYRILIQQITHTLENKQDKQLTEIVKNNLEEASLVASKYHQVVRKLKTVFRDRVMEILAKEIETYRITKQSIDKNYSNLWFHHKGAHEGRKVWFGVETFSGKGHKNGLLLVGIFDKHSIMPTRTEFMPINKAWIHHQPLYFENREIRVSENAFLERISEPETLEQVAISVAAQIKEFIAAHDSIVTPKENNVDNR